MLTGRYRILRQIPSTLRLHRERGWGYRRALRMRSRSLSILTGKKALADTSPVVFAVRGRARRRRLRARFIVRGTSLDDPRFWLCVWHGHLVAVVASRDGRSAGLCLALGTRPTRRRVLARQLFLREQPAVSHPIRHSQPFYVSFVGWALVGLFCVSFCVLLGRSLWTSRNFARQRRIYAEYRSTRPSLADLPPFQPMDPEDVS